MSLESDIEQVLFDIGRDVKIHKLIDGNLIIEINYEKYTEKIIEIFHRYSQKPE